MNSKLYNIFKKYFFVYIIVIIIIKIIFILFLYKPIKKYLISNNYFKKSKLLMVI